MTSYNPGTVRRQDAWTNNDKLYPGTIRRQDAWTNNDKLYPGDRKTTGCLDK